MKWAGPGWSPDPEQVNTTRVVAALMGSLNEHGQTKKSVTAVLTELGLPPRASAALALHLARHLGCLPTTKSTCWCV